VTIRGRGFTGATSVAFNGIPATSFTITSDNDITAVVPKDATTGPISITSGGTAVGQSSFTVQPDIVLILTDDQRFDQMDHMPTVSSKLQSKGVTFRNAFVVNPLCCPSRTTILTGKYSHGTGVYTNSPPNGGFEVFTNSSGDQSTVATWLDDAGYRTALVGKYLNGYSFKRARYVPPGWDVWNAFALAGAGGYYDYYMSIDGARRFYGHADADYSTDVLATRAKRFITTTSSQEPLFLMFAPKAPHWPATPPTRYADRFANLPPIRYPSYNESDVSDKPSYIQAAPLLAPDVMEAEDAHVRQQYESLLAVDDAVRRILLALRGSGRLANTLIVFASDNGYEHGEHRFREKKVPYEESIRVPLIVRFDALRGNSAASSSSIVLNLDFAPTFAAAASLGAPGVEGESFLDLLQGSSAGWRTDFLIEHVEADNDVPTYCAVRSRRFKYVQYATGEEELYQLAKDPYELNNRARSSGAFLQNKRASMHDRMVELCRPPPPGYIP
jgi:arylsulfatase A-like enzyme